MIQQWLAKNAVLAAIIAALLALLLVQTTRLEGLRVWPVTIEGWKPRALRDERDLKAIKDAQKQALRAAQEARERVEANYRDLARRTDDDAQEARVGALADAAEYIRTHRVRCQAAGGAGGGTVAVSPDSSPGGGQGPGGTSELDDAVAVTADDVRICTNNTVRLEAARAWALGLEGVSR